MAYSNLCTAPETQGSDEEVELFCEACLKEGNKIGVSAYCIDCDEYFCTLCQKYHTRYLRDHKILDGDNVPKDVEKCPIHMQMIKLYCNTCGEFACCMCTTHSSFTAEKPCKLSPILELSKNVEQSEELNDFIAKLDKIETTAAEEMKLNESKLKNMADQSKREVQQYKDKILEKAEEMNSQIDKRKQTDSAKLSALTIKIKDLSNKFQQRHASARSQQIQTFIVMKQMKSEIELLEIEMDEITAEMDQLNYIFEPDTIIIHVTKENQTFGTLITKPGTTDTEEVQMEKRKIAVYQYEISEEDIGNKFELTDFCVLPGQILAVCDSKEKSVKLFNASKRSLIATWQIKTTPTAITYIENRQFAVAQHKKTSGLITFILWSENDTLHSIKGKHFEVESQCLGITHDPDRHTLIVLLWDGTYGKIQIIDTGIMFGTILETFPTDFTGSPIFSNYTWMTLDKKQNILYASTLHLDRLTTIHLDMEEDDIDRIKYSFLLAPNGIACDSQGCIYASLHGNNKVIYLNPECSEESEDILTENDDICAPETLKYCEEDNLLYVHNMNTINVFKIIEIECVWKETLERIWKWEPISTSEIS